MPENDTIDIVFDDNTAIHVEYTAFISVPAGLTLRSLLTAEYDVKRLVKLAKDQKLFRQFLLSYSDDDNIPSALLAGVDTQRRRRRRRDTSPEFPKSRRALWQITLFLHDCMNLINSSDISV